MTTAAMQRVIQALKRIGSRESSPGEWTCPAHDDESASLSMRQGRDGDKVVLKCGAGCETQTVLRALGLGFRDLFDDPAAFRDHVVGEPVRYVYRDEDGGRLFRVTRKNMASGKKRFYQQGAKMSGGWKSGHGAMDGVRLVLWLLPDLIDAIDDGATIHLCEGEKDVKALHEADAFATCHPMGAGKWRDTYTEQLAGAERVVVWADRDAAGYRCAHQRLSALLAAGIPARAVLPIPDFKGADVYDHLDAGHSPEDGKPVTASELLALAEAVDLHGADSDAVLDAVKRELLIAASADLAQDHLMDVLRDSEILDLPPQRFVIDGWVPAGAYTTVYGPPGIGKTLILLGMHRAVRRGTRWQDNATTQGLAVSYVGEEVHQLQERLRSWDSRYPLREDQRMAAGFTVPRMVDLTKPEGVAAVIRTVRALEAQHGDKVQLLTFDPLVEFMTGDENGEGMDKATRGLRALAPMLDCGVVVGHHTNASEARARGADHLRMRCGTHIRMERLDEVVGAVGLVQEKQRNAARSAMTLELRTEGESVVLEWRENYYAQDYLAAQADAAKQRREDGREVKAAKGRAEREKALLTTLRELHDDDELPISQSHLNKTAGGNREAFKLALTALAERGIVTVVEQGVGKPNLVSLDPKWLADVLGEDA